MPSPPPTMRRVIVSASGAIELREVRTPEPEPGEALVRTLVSGVCGSDTRAVQGLHAFLPLPYPPGHEVVGVVERVPDATDLQVGQRVTVQPTLPCGSCKQCALGRDNLCDHLRVFGCVHDQGGMADYFTIAASRLHRVPDDFTDELAALVEPLATPVHAVRLAADPSEGLTGSTVAVIGAGTIGLLTLAAARRRGARRVVVTDVSESKLRRALRLGADGVVNADEPEVAGRVREKLGESADVVFDCVATQPTISQAVAMSLKGGTVVVVGVPPGPVTVPLPIVQDQQIRIQGAATYVREDFGAAIELLGSGVLDAADFVTATYSLDRADEAFAAAADGEQVKVLVRPVESAP